jgi:hypothetical protein
MTKSHFFSGKTMLLRFMMACNWYGPIIFINVSIIKNLIRSQDDEDIDELNPPQAVLPMISAPVHVTAPPMALTPTLPLLPQHPVTPATAMSTAMTSMPMLPTQPDIVSDQVSIL